MAKTKKKKNRFQRYIDQMPATKAFTATKNLVGSNFKKAGEVTKPIRENIGKLKIGKKIADSPGVKFITNTPNRVVSGLNRVRKAVTGQEPGPRKGQSYKTTPTQRAKTFKSDKKKSKKDKSYNKGYDKKDHVSSAYERRQKDLTATTQANAAESHKQWQAEQARLAKLRRENPEAYKKAKKQIEADRAARKAKRSGVNMA